MTETLDDVLTIDVREIPGPQRHPRIFGTLEMLRPGQALHIVVDHDPVPLRYHFATHFSDVLGWQYLEHGPQLWKIEIRRLKHEGCGCSCGSNH